MRRIIYPLTCLFLLLHCQSKDIVSLSCESYVKYFLENKNLFEFKAKNKSPYDFSITYNPIEFLIAKSIIGDDLSESEAIEKYSGFKYLTFRVSSKNGKLLSALSEDWGFEDEQKLLSSLHFDLGKNFKLVIGKNELLPAYYHLEFNKIIEEVLVFNIVFKDSNSKLNAELKNDTIFKFVKDDNNSLVEITLEPKHINCKPRLII